jgi:hypothetical protein
MTKYSKAREVEAARRSGVPLRFNRLTGRHRSTQTLRNSGLSAREIRLAKARIEKLPSPRRRAASDWGDGSDADACRA